MSDLEPITREEKLLDGQELEPITRKEMFIKRIYDKTQTIPEPVTREEYFLKKAGEGGGGDVTIEQLNVSENGTYSEQGKAYSPVVVNVPSAVLGSLSVTENGTYTPSQGTDGFNEVTVNVPLPQNALLLKDIPSTPTAIATFDDGAEMVMPSLTVGVDAWQEGSGDPSPTNERPIHGRSSANIITCGDSTEIEYFENLSKGIYGVVDLGSLTWSYETTLIEGIEVFQAIISGRAAGTTTLSCPLYANVETRGKLVTNDMTMARLNSSSSAVLIRNDSYTDATAFKTAMSGVKLIYELSEPTEPTVTPSELQAIISSYNVSSQITTINLNGTRYGGRLEVVNGVAQFVATKGYIASYNGETLPSDWISDRDVYSEGATPTVGAEVVYTLATPIIIPLGNYPISSLVGDNNLFADSGEILDGEYLGGVS